LNKLAAVNTEIRNYPPVIWSFISPSCGCVRKREADFCIFKLSSGLGLEILIPLYNGFITFYCSGLNQSHRVFLGSLK
jgi:hypothetical protein